VIQRYDTVRLDAVFGALAHAKRRAILHDLSMQPATVGALAATHQLSLPAIHKHIRTLENASLIVRRKVGRTNFVALKSRSLVEPQSWINQYRTGWGSDEATLQNYIAKIF
jgi:DNA-binding transcriptional ArsR family regulator